MRSAVTPVDLDIDLDVKPGGARAAWARRARPARPGVEDRRRRRRGLLFVSPWLIGLAAFYVIPLIASLVLSFTDYELVDQDDKPTEFIGLDNWERLIDDPDVRHSAWVTLKFAIVFLPLSLVLPLGLAYLLTSRHLWGAKIFRTLFYLPAIVPFIASAFVWQGYFNDTSGWFNRLLDTFGIDGPDWINQSAWALPALEIIALWAIGNAIIIYMAAMRSVPVELYEAAHLDGAGPWQMFRHVTWHLISPVTFYNLVIALVALGQYFIVPYVLTDGNGDPNGSTLFYTMYLYRQTFTFHEGGYGSALATAMFVVIMTATAIVFWSARHWVHYEYQRVW